MRRYWFLIFVVVSCANPIPPTGGPRDLDPPQLLSTTPEYKTLNFNGSEIIMEFDEYIKEENLLTQLMITPNLEGLYNYRVNRNRITLSFEEPFDSATTYTLNFREGIKDITEGNVPPNLNFVFSTGNFLDSASVNGVVRNLMTKEPLEDITISLYIDPDTVTVFDSPPRYSTLTDKEGRFVLENIKTGNYLIYAVADKNRNLKLETRTEAYGFHPTPLHLNDSLPPMELQIFSLDTRPIVLQNSRPVAGNYDLKFNKALASYQLPEHEPILDANLVEDNQTLRIYFTDQVKDSLAVPFVVSDSLQQSLDSLVYVKFESTSRKPEDFTLSNRLKSGPVNKFWQTTFKFNKPVTHINYDSIYFRFDSLYHIPLVDSMLVANHSNDSYQLTFDFYQYLKEDSIFRNWQGDFQLIIANGSIVSVENDTLKSSTTNYSFKKPKEFGIIRGNIDTQYSSYQVQLLDRNFEVVEELQADEIDNNLYEFIHIEPGSYSIRVLVDEDNNGKWDPGNILDLTPSEKVVLLYHPNVDGNEVIKLRANWEQSGLDIVF